MVVDDDQDVRHVISSLLNLEFETVEAKNSLDALERLDRYEPDVLLVEANMPIMNGIALSGAIRRNPDYKEIPVFYLSNSTAQDLRESALSSGAIGFMEKPFQGSKLIESLKSGIQNGLTKPRSKDFTVDELLSFESITEFSDIHKEGLNWGGLKQPAKPGEKKPADKKRRVFGKKASKEVENAPALKGKDATDIGLPPAPVPEYKAFSQKQSEEKKREREEQNLKSGDEETRPALNRGDILERSADSEPADKKSKPSERPLSKQPSKPPSSQVVQNKAEPEQRKERVSSSSELSPAEILARRRMRGLSGIRKSADKGSLPRIMVLIDKPDQLQTYHGAIRGLGEFLPLEDPVEAIELIARFQPDLIVLSIVEQQYNGLQIAQMLKSNPRLANTEVLFVQNAWCEEKHLTAARNLTRNPMLHLPLMKQQIITTVKSIISKPGFEVTEKTLSYGIYVKEVIRAAEEERQKENKAKEKEAYADHMHSLVKFMATELKDYKEPQGYDELKGPGNKVHKVN